MHLVPNGLKSHEPASLTLQVIDHGRQGAVLSAASAIWAAISSLTMDRRSEMLVQRLQHVEYPVAEIALEALDVTVPSIIGGPVGYGLVPLREFL